MFTDLPNLICKACATVNTNIFLFGLRTNVHDQHQQAFPVIYTQFEHALAD